MRDGDVHVRGFEQARGEAAMDNRGREVHVCIGESVRGGEEGLAAC